MLVPYESIFGSKLTTYVPLANQVDREAEQRPRELHRLGSLRLRMVRVFVY